MLRTFCFALGLLGLVSCTNKNAKIDSWSHYLGDPERSHFTTLSQISPNNLDSLEVAWTFESPDTGQMQMNPIVIDGVLYGISAGLKVFALDAETGHQIWMYDDNHKKWSGTSRGVSYWQKGNDQRILFTRGDELIALDANTGRPITSFGQDGKVNLHLGLPDVAQDKFIISNTPGAIYQDLIILPYRLSEGPDAAPGDIRAFNIEDGSLEWTFHVLPYPDEKGYDSWENKDAFLNTEGIGAGNNWSGITVDEKAGILYIPTGSFAPDFYGGHRPGMNLYSNCLLALHAENGKLIWYQQLTHHDIWDRDLPAPPNLLTVRKDGKLYDAIVQITKQGYVYTFDQYTGEPIYEIKEVPVPASNLERSWPTQPIPVKPEPYARLSNEISADDYSPYAPNREEIIEMLQIADNRFYNPPDTTPTLLLPGYDGGAEWGGAGVDPDNGIIYINSNEMAWILEMKKVTATGQDSVARGAFFYANVCSTCHGKQLEGNDESGYPSLRGVEERLSKTEILSIINNGKGMMPGFAVRDREDIEAVVNFISGLPDVKMQRKPSLEEQYGIPYKHGGYKKFLDANGLPALNPPWGTLNAIDMNTGEYIWKKTFGEIDSLIALGYPATGSENYGGPIITENGLLIIAATKDGKARIYDRHNGELLWWDRLPAASFATPSTYMFDGRQYIVFACGGEKLGTPPGNKIIAYSIEK